MAELEVTPNWNNPDAKRGTVNTSASILKEATHYYRWLFSTKDSGAAAALLMLGTPDKNPLSSKDS